MTDHYELQELPAEENDSPMIMNEGTNAQKNTMVLSPELKQQGLIDVKQQPIKAPWVNKKQMPIRGNEEGMPKCIPLYPSTKWGVYNPKLHQYWKEKETRA